jgi:hypothetical protein
MNLLVRCPLLHRVIARHEGVFDVPVEPLDADRFIGADALSTIRTSAAEALFGRGGNAKLLVSGSGWGERCDFHRYTTEA